MKALGNEKRLQVLEWLRDPVANFPPQLEGDLVEDGVCALFIAEKLGISQPTCGEHLKLLSRSGLVRARRSSSGSSTSATRNASPRQRRSSPVTGDTRAQHLVLTRDDIRHAYDTVRPYLRRTPVIQLDLAGPVTMKLEQLQCAGFVQGPRRVHEPPAQGRAARRGWRPRRRQHGVAVAYAAHRLGIPARIFVPTVSSPAKIERIRELADLVIAGDRYADALEASGAVDRDVRRDERARLRPAGDHTRPGPPSPWSSTTRPGRLDTVLAPVGGGGLIAGIASYFAGSARIIGVSPTARLPSSAPGRPAHPSTPRQAASPSMPSHRGRVGDLVFPITQAHVADVVLVDDDAIRGAQRTLWQTARIAAEPAASVGVAALLAGAYKPAPGERVAVINQRRQT